MDQWDGAALENGQRLLEMRARVSRLVARLDQTLAASREIRERILADQAKRARVRAGSADESAARPSLGS